MLNEREIESCYLGQFIPVHYHHNMLMDQNRMHSFKSAIHYAVFPGARALRVPGDRFAPVKTTGDLLAVASDAFTLTDDWRVVPTPGRAGDLVVDLDAAHYGRVDQLEAHFPFGPPSLVACTRLRVTGDVRFGAGVVCRGDVAVRGGTGSAVADGAVLSGAVEIPAGGTSSP